MRNITVVDNMDSKRQQIYSDRDNYYNYYDKGIVYKTLRYDRAVHTDQKRSREALVNQSTNFTNHYNTTNSYG